MHSAVSVQPAHRRARLVTGRKGGGARSQGGIGPASPLVGFAFLRDGAHGLLFRHPVPPHIDGRACIDRIDPAKDVDGVTKLGFWRVTFRLPAFGAAMATDRPPVAHLLRPKWIDGGRQRDPKAGASIQHELPVRPQSKIVLDSAPGSGGRNERVHRQERHLKQDTQYRTVAQTAALLGVTTKALRVYERHGLVTPVRSGAGYRTYGPAQMRRLHQVLALKSFGLSLSRIGACLAGLGDDLKLILEGQEKDLRSRVAALQDALILVAEARTRLASGQNLSMDDLVTLTREIVVTTGKSNWRGSLAPLFEKYFTAAEREKMSRPVPEAARDVEATERNQLLAEARALAAGDPGTPEAMELARRWRDRAAKFAGGDKTMLGKMRAVFDEALSDPAISETLPWREEMAFIRAATAKLEAAGG